MYGFYRGVVKCYYYEEMFFQMLIQGMEEDEE